MHKNVAAWGDTTNNYREGFPEKDAKAPKRREKLMAAIKLADVRWCWHPTDFVHCLTERFVPPSG